MRTRNIRLSLFFFIVAFALTSTCKADETVVPLSILKGTEHTPFLQVFTVPVQCGTVKGDFTWGCYGVTQISESFARKCNVAIVPTQELGEEFLGKANLAIQFGGATYNVEVSIIKDSQCQDSEKTGVIGTDISKSRQWTIDPQARTLTLRDNGSEPQGKPLAVLDLGDEGTGLSIKIKLRNETAEVGLMPGSSFVQVAPELQRKWDLGGTADDAKEAPKVFGNVKIVTIHGKDQLEVAPNVAEREVKIALVGDAKHPEATPFAQSGVGQSLLNRWVYTVDEDKRKFYILKRVEPGKAVPSTAHSNSATGDQDTMDEFLKENKK